MGLKIKFRRSVFVLVAIITAVFILVKCMDGSNEEKISAGPAGREEYTDSHKCASCHKKIYDSYLQTAHYLTAQPASENYIKGSFHK